LKCEFGFWQLSHARYGRKLQRPPAARKKANSYFKVMAAINAMAARLKAVREPDRG
jgi:hypothetical protein